MSIGRSLQSISQFPYSHIFSWPKGMFNLRTMISSKWLKRRWFWAQVPEGRPEYTKGKYRFKKLMLKLFVLQIQSKDWLVMIDHGTYIFTLRFYQNTGSSLLGLKLTSQVLHYGLVLSPHTFTKGMDAALSSLQLQSIYILDYWIDDWLILAQLKEMAAGTEMFCPYKVFGSQVEPQEELHKPPGWAGLSSLVQCWSSSIVPISRFTPCYP